MFQLLKKYRNGSTVLVLIALVLANIVSYNLAKKYYVEARAAAVFPSHALSFREKNNALSVKTRERIVLFGDSRISQWKNFPEPTNFEVVNRGIAGETTAQMRTRFEQDVLALHPDIVVLQLGINDLVALGALPDRHAEIASQCATNIRYFVDGLQTRNIRTVLLTIIPPDPPPFWRRPVWNDRIAAEVEKLNSYWIETSGSPVLRVIDTRSLLQDAQGRWHAGVTADTLHLTQRGYEYLNAAVMPLLGSWHGIPRASLAPVKRDA